MMKAGFAKILIGGGLLGVMVWGMPARGADPEIAMQRQLDQPLTLSLKDIQVSEAFAQIAKQAGVPLTVDPSCYDLLPYGATTLVSVNFSQSKLRDSLEVLLMPLGLQTTVAGTTVMIRPSDALRRIGHRADWEELKLLKDLWSSADLKPGSNGVFSLPEAIRSSVADHRRELQVPLAGEANGAFSQVQEQAIAQIAKQLPMSAYRALDMYCMLTKSVWFVEAGPLLGGDNGGRVRIMSHRQWIERQLELPIQIARKNEPLEVVVADLTHASGIHFKVQAGLYQAVPVVSVQSTNATVRQTLESLQGASPILFKVGGESKEDEENDTILLQLVNGGTSSAARSDSIVGRISVPVGGTGGEGTMMDVYIKESDLTPEQNEMRKKHIEDALKELQKTWTTPSGVTAGTQPKGTEK
ncbi:MAG TPA: hypothetical protein VGN88_09440 [Phycisphaerae bacterium]|jgi:hypothetical protein